MPQSFDPLYEIFDKHLNSGLRQTDEEIIDAVVQEYLLFLVRQGMAPHTQGSALREDIQLEVRDMLKIKTYGHFDLRHYNMAKKKAG